MISPLAYVDSAAKIGKNVTIQPFAFIEGNVEIGDDCIIMSGAKILHGTRMGKGNKVHHNAVLGAEPQDFHYTGESSMLIIGDNNDIRENVVISRATHAGSATRIGNENYLMDGVHLCHDVQIGNHCVLGIKTTVAGECQIDDCTILSSNVILHQYCHIGSWVLIQAGCRISKDVPPYIITMYLKKCFNRDTPASAISSKSSFSGTPKTRFANWAIFFGLCSAMNVIHAGTITSSPAPCVTLYTALISCSRKCDAQSSSQPTPQVPL